MLYDLMLSSMRRASQYVVSLLPSAARSILPATAPPVRVAYRSIVRAWRKYLEICTAVPK